MWNDEQNARYAFDHTQDFFNTSQNAAPEESMQEYWLYESFIRTDFDGDGIAELRKVCTVGSTILANDEIDNMPFISLTPIQISHKFFGFLWLIWLCHCRRLRVC